MNRWSALAVPLVLLLAFAGALFFRLPKLDTRPLHNDEAVNAFKAAELWQEGRYHYDPDEYHGPTLHYATVPFLRLSGAANAHELQDRTLRLAPVFFGAGLILLLFFVADGLGRHATVWAAAFLAISPAMVFYSRYFIHEMLLVFFTALAIAAGWRYSQSRTPGWAVAVGAGIGLMFATKETFVLTLAALGVALTVSVWRGSSERISPRALLALFPLKHCLLAFAATTVVWLLFFSSFFTNWRGLLDSALTYFPWLKRAGGHSPHIHPWYFYLERLAWFHPMKGPAWSEALILGLALIGGITSFRRVDLKLGRFLTIYTVVLTGIYSAISYKTPWCLLSFYLGMILLAGIGAATLLECCRAPSVRVIVGIIVLTFATQLAFQSWRANFVYSADRRNPYVYAQTAPDILNLVSRAEGLGRVSPDAFATVIKVMAPEGDYWPLPWYLRRFKNIGWYEVVPEDPYAPIIICSANFAAQLDDKSERKWIMAGITELRPGKFFELYVEFELWKKYVETLPPPPEE